MNEKSKTRVAPFFGALGLVLLPLVSAGTELSKLRLDAAGIEREARLVNLRFDRAASVITLDDAELIEDDAPATGVPEGMDLNGKEEWIENLKKGIVIKKILLLDDPAAVFGTAPVQGDRGQGQHPPRSIISLNGVGFLRPPTVQAAPFARQYIDYSPERPLVLHRPPRRGAPQGGERDPPVGGQRIHFLARAHRPGKGVRPRLAHPHPSSQPLAEEPRRRENLERLAARADTIPWMANIPSGSAWTVT